MSRGYLSGRGVSVWGLCSGESLSGDRTVKSGRYASDWNAFFFDKIPKTAWKRKNLDQDSPPCRPPHPLERQCNLMWHKLFTRLGLSFNIFSGLPLRLTPVSWSLNVPIPETFHCRTIYNESFVVVIRSVIKDVAFLRWISHIQKYTTTSWSQVIFTTWYLKSWVSYLSSGECRIFRPWIIRCTCFPEILTLFT